MSKVASAAATLGVGEDQLAAQLSTIISVTRQAPETVGTALRTVYARITDIEAGLDEDGVTLGKYSGDMAKIGINVLDLNGNLRNMGEVMEEIGNKWSTMTQEQKIYLAQTMAGQRQYSNLMALFDNFDKYESALNTAQNAEGKLQEQQDVYMDRLSTHVQQLTTATEHMWMGLTDTDGFKDIIDSITTIVEKVDKLFQSIGGGKNLLQSLVPIVMSLTSKTVASGINTMIINSQLEKRQLRDQKNSQVLAQNEMRDLQKDGQQGSQRYQVLKQKSEFLQAAPGTFSAQQMGEINQRWSGSLEAADAADKARSRLASVSGAVEIVSGINPLDTKVSIDTLEGAIETASKSYKDLSNSVHNFIQQQNATNQSQDEAQKNLINAYNQAVKEEQEIIQEENERQQVLSKAAKRFGVVSMPGQPIQGTTLQQLSTKVNAAQRQQQTSINNIQQSIDFATVNQGQSFLTGDAYKGIVNSLNGKKITQAQFGALEQLSQFQTLQNFDGTDKNIELQRLLQGSIFEDVFNDQKDDSGKVTQDKFIVAIKNRVISLKQSLEKAEQELGKIQDIKNNFIPSNNYAQFSQNAAQDVQDAQNALKNQSQTNLTIQHSGKFTQILDILNKQLPQAASESKEKLLDFSQRFNDINKKVLDFNTSIGKTDLSNTDEIQKLIEEREKLIQERADFLQEFEDFSNDVGDNITSQGEEALRTQRNADSIIENNDEANNDTQNDAERQKAIQSLIQLASGTSQAIAGFQSLIKIGDIWSNNTITTTEKIDQSFSNLLVNLPMITSGIISVVTALESYDEIVKLLKTDLTLNLKEKLKHLAVDTKNYYLTIKNSAANLGFAGTLKAVGAKLKEVTASAATAQMTLGSFLIVIAAVTAAVLLLKAAAQKNSKQAQATIEQNKKLIEQEKEKQDLLVNQKNMIDQLKEINKQYQDGSISRAQLKDKINELEEKYKDESDTIQKLTQDYSNLTSAIKKAQEAYDQDKLKSDKRIADAKANIARNTEQGEVKGGEWWRAADLGQLNARARGDTVIQVGTGDVEFGQKLRTELQGRQAGKGQGNAMQATILGGLMMPGPVGMGIGYALGKNSLTQVDINDIQTKQQLKKVVQGLQAAIDSATEEEKNTSTFNSTMQTLTSLQEQLKEWENADLLVLNDLVTIAAKNVDKNFNDVDNFQEYQKAYQESSRQIYNELKDEEEFKSQTPEEQSKIIAQKIEALIPDDLKENYGNQMDAVNKINHYNGAGFFGVQETDDEIIDLINGLNEEQLLKFSSIDIEYLPTLNDVKDILKAIDGYEFKNLEFNTADAKKAAQTYNNMANALQKVQNSKAIFTKDFEENLGLTDEIKEYFRLGNNGYVLKDESQREEVERLIKEQQRSGWDEKYRIQQNIKENEQVWMDSAAKGYNYQKYNQDQQQSNFDKAQQMLDKLATINDDDVQLNVEIYKKFLANGEISKQNYETIYNYFDELSKKHKDAADKITQANEQQQEALQQIHESIFPMDDDVDETLVAKLGQQFQLTAKKSKLLDDALKSNAEKAKDVAEEVQRYNVALSSVIKNYTTWQDKLSGSTADKLSVAPQIKDAMADTLGISESTLSDTFATTKQNLEDMRLALEGDEKAYKRLQQAAYEDILIHIGLDDAELNKVKTDLSAYFDKLDLEKIPVGAELNEQGLDKVLAALIAKGVDAEQQLEAIFASFDIDLDVVIEDGKAIIKSYTKAATHELKEQQKSQEELKDLERERIKNQKELTKFLKDERDIYHQINRLLSDQERTIKRITRNQQDMYGTELLDNLNAESAEYEKQQKLLKSKQKLQQQDLANKKAGLASKGASFDANGNINNYNNLIGSAINNVNSIISRERGVQEAMNQHLLSGGNTGDEIYKDLDAQLSSIGREKSQANDYLNDLKTELSNYEKVKDQAEDVADQLTELSEKQIEINLKKFNMKLEVTLDLSQATKTWNDYKRNVLQHDDIFNPNRALSAQNDNAQRLADINADSQSLNIVNKQIAEAMADNGTLYKTQGQKKKAIEELQKKAIQLRKGILENEDAIKQTYLEQYDIISEMFEKQKSQYDFVNNQLEHNKNMMSLIYGENDYAVQNVYNDKMIENSLKSIESMNNRVQIAEENLRKARESGDTAVIEKAEAEWQTAIQNRNQLEEQSAQLMKDRYTTAINQIAHQMEQKLTNNKGFNYMDTEWDLMKKQSNLYLDDINSAFAVKNTEYLYNQVLNDTKGLKSQQQLKKVMSEQLDILKEKDKLTQYDVDRAQKVLEIEKARIALEQARNNKTQMRLKRDSQGNYSYQYVADQDNIAKVENDLAKAENDLYNFDKDNYENKLKEAYDATKEYQEKITALEIEYATATEERRKQIDEEKRLLDQQYSEYILNLSQETEWGKQNLMQSTMMNFSDMMNQEQIDFENMSDAQKEKWLGDMVPSINSGIAEMIGKFSTNPDSFKQIVIEATQAMDNERKTYQEGLAELQAAAKQDWNKIKQAMDPVVELQNKLIEGNDRLKEQAGEIVEAMNGTLDALDTQRTKWEKIYEQTDSAVERVYDYIAAIDKAALKKINQDKKSEDIKDTRIQTIPTVNNLKTYGNTAPGNVNNGIKNGNGLATAGVTTGKGTNEKNTYKAKNEIEARVMEIWNNRGKFFKEAPTKNEYLAAFNSKGDKVKADAAYKGKITSWRDWNFKYTTHTAEQWDNIVRNNLSTGGRPRPTGMLSLSQFKQALPTYPQYIIENIYSNYKELSGFIGPTLQTFDTGGYTGNWSSTQGKLAVLHQKELVLNKQDTKNMLEMIQMVREMQQNELKMRMTQLNNEIQDIVKQSAQIEKIQSKDELQQSVEMNVTFPNVNSKKEIEQALTELVNLAAQRALKYKK